MDVRALGMVVRGGNIRARVDGLRAQVEEAGFTVDTTRRLTPGEPLMAMVATAS